MADRPGVTLSPATTNQGHLPDDDVEHNASTTPALASCLQPQSPSWAAAVAVIAIVLLILAYVLGHKKVLNSLCQRIRTLITRRTPGAGTNGNSDGQLREVLTTGSQGDHRVSEQSPLMGVSPGYVTSGTSPARQSAGPEPTHDVPPEIRHYDVPPEIRHRRKFYIDIAFSKVYSDIVLRSLGLDAAWICARELLKKQVISKRQYELIQDEGHPVRRAHELCHILREKGKRGIVAFVDILSTMDTAEKKIAKAIQDEARKLGLDVWPGNT